MTIQDASRVAAARRRTAPMPTGIAAGAGFAGAIVATLIAVMIGSTHDPLLALIPLGLVTVVVAATSNWAGGIATAWICWSLDSGFVLGRQGQLTFSPAAGLAALLLVGGAVFACASGAAMRRARALSSANR